MSVPSEPTMAASAPRTPSPAGRPSSPGTWRRRERLRRGATEAVVLLDVLTVSLALAGVHGLAREVVGLCAVLLVPGVALVGLLRVRDPALELALVLAVGLSALVLVAQFVITVQAWHLFAVQVVVLLACLPSLLWQLARPATSRARRR